MPAAGERTAGRDLAFGESSLQAGPGVALRRLSGGRHGGQGGKGLEFAQRAARDQGDFLY